MILCACGCGIFIEDTDSRGRPHKFIHGHSNRNPSLERRKNMSNSQKGEKNGFYGKHHSEESKQINREKHLGKPLPHTKKWDENISQSLLGKHPSKKTKLKQSISHMGQCAELAGNWKGGKKLAWGRKRAKRKEAGFGFVPLNNCDIDGWEGHHLDYDYVIFIPEELHKSIYHSVTKDINMDIINDRVYNWFVEYYGLI